MRAILIVLLLCGCYKTQSVSGAAAQLKTPGINEAILAGASGPVRLDPRSVVRFLTISGDYTPWIRASLLTTNETGVFWEAKYKVASIERAQVSGLSEEDLALLITSIPDGCSTREAPQSQPNTNLSQSQPSTMAAPQSQPDAVLLVPQNQPELPDPGAASAPTTTEASSMPASAPSPKGECALTKNEDGVIELSASNGLLGEWLLDFELSLAARYTVPAYPYSVITPEEKESLCGLWVAPAQPPPGCKGEAPTPKEPPMTAEEYYLDKIDEIHESNLGHWRFYTPLGWSDSIEGKELTKTVGAFVSLDGILWTEISGLEVNNLAGGVTLAGVVYGAGATATIGVASAFVGLFLLPFSLIPGFGQALDIAYVKFIIYSAAVAAHPHEKFKRPWPGKRPDAFVPQAKSDPSEAAPPDSKDAERIFSVVAQRRSIAQLVAATELSVSRNEPTAAAALSLRLFDVWELGGGARLYTSSQGDEQWGGFFRSRIDLGLGAKQIFSLPFGLEIGRVSGSPTLETEIGLRIKLTQGLSIGLYPANPTCIYIEQIPECSFPTSFSSRGAWQDKIPTFWLPRILLDSLRAQRDKAKIDLFLTIWEVRIS